MIKNSIITPLQKFVNIESFAGILLLAATIIALFWANSPFGSSYTALWQHELGFSTPILEIEKPLILWVNDGLMAVFFFLIGLEIKRELLIGELNSIKKIAFPLFGALGGMLIPVMFFLLINQNPETTKGWGIPMATDIAFSLAVLKVLGKRIPLSLIIFLTAFAIVDDLGAVMVIALFYSGELHLELLGYASILLAILYYLSYKEVYFKYLSTAFGVIVWILFLKSGIHPTLAGILMAFSVPIRQKILTREFIAELETITQNIKQAKVLNDEILSNEQIIEIDNLEDLTEKYQSPLQKLEHNLHGWVAYFIIPIFALANAGVAFGDSSNLDTMLIINIIICLVLGKSMGITSIILLAKKLNIIDIPSDINVQHIIGVSFLAGIGFTMAIFIAGLAFQMDPVYIDSAKIGILIGSLASAILGYFVLRFAPSQQVKTDKPK
ncbi:Na+/H+ antiporter NhaA [Flavobacteriaceae bacterium Ap0902]|nr:Na+/H+ antiporter NhaA [Flavobacteriaceae bacterium Ap0902]